MRHVGVRHGLALASLTLLALSACGRGGAPAADRRTAVWLDISPAIGDPPRDPGSALALLQAYGSERLRVRGVSVTFGNAPLVRSVPAARELMERLNTGLLRPWRGASSPEERAAPTEATELLEEALSKETLTIVAVGPATTLASVLLRQPEMAARIERVVLVAGRSGDAAAPAGAPESPDPTVTADAGSLRVLLASPLALTLVPADGSTGIGLDAADIDRLDQGRGPVKLITPAAPGWLQVQKSRGGGDAFPMPAMIAVDVAAHPGKVRCESAVAALEAPGGDGARLLVSTATAGRRVTWCHTARADDKARMIADVLRVQPLAR